MRPRPITLLTLGFFIGLAGGAAAQPSSDLEAPIATSALEIVEPDVGPLGPPPSVSTGPLNLAESRSEVSVETPDAAERPLGAALQPEPRRQGEVVQLGRNAALVARRNGVAEPTGGFLRANPQLEKRNRRTIGLALRF